MAKQQKSVPKGAEGTKLKETNPMKVNPKKEQFEPTPAAPYRQRFRMAGGC